MSITKSHDLLEGVTELAEEWSRLVAAVALTLSPDTSDDARRALVDTNLTLYRSLALFLCGGSGGRRDPRDISPSDFLGSDWWPSDDELDQRLRGRLDKISKVKSHLTWHRVEDQQMVLWPWALLVWEISFALEEFTRALNGVNQPLAEPLKRTKDDLRPHMPPKDYPVATNEHATARAGQRQYGLS